jgi:hypothetical protein
MADPTPEPFILLSSAELFVILSAMGAGTLPALVDAQFTAMSEAEMRGAVRAGRDALMARGLARLSDDRARLEINPVALVPVALACVPQAGFWLMIGGRDRKPTRSAFYNMTRGGGVVNTFDADGIHKFQLLPDEAALYAHVRAACALAPLPQTDTSRSYALPPGALAFAEHEPLNATTSAKLEAALRSAGAPATQSVIFAEAFANADRRVVIVCHTPGQTPDADPVISSVITCLASHGAGWQIVAAADGAATVSGLSEAGLRQTLIMALEQALGKLRDPAR